MLLCYESNLKYINLYGRGVKKLTYLLQKCFDLLNISYYWVPVALSQYQTVRRRVEINN